MNQPINSIVDTLNQVREQLNLVAGSSGVSAYPRDNIGIILKPRDNMGIVPGLLIYPCIHCGAIKRLLKKKQLN